MFNLFLATTKKHLKTSVSLKRRQCSICAAKNGVFIKH